MHKYGLWYKYLHGAVGIQFGCSLGLHDAVEVLIGHDSCYKELRGANVVQRQGLNLGDVDSHFPMNSGALDANDHAKVGG